MQRLNVTFEFSLTLEDDDPLLNMPDGELEEALLRLVREEGYALSLTSAEAEPASE